MVNSCCKGLSVDFTALAYAVFVSSGVETMHIIIIYVRVRQN